MTRSVYAGSAAEQVWVGLRQAGCSSAFALPCRNPREVFVHVSQIEAAQRWLVEHGLRRGPARSRAAEQLQMI